MQIKTLHRVTFLIKNHLKQVLVIQKSSDGVLINDLLTSPFFGMCTRQNLFTKHDMYLRKAVSSLFLIKQR